MSVTRFLLTICLLVLAAAHASADPAGEQLFRDGRALLKAGKVDEACEKFQESRDVEAKFGTVLNLADCRERQGKFATAWELFLEAKALATTQKGERDLAEATRRAKKIEGKRAFLTVTITAEARVPGLVVTRNGSEVASSTWDQALPIDPGSYVIEAKAGGYEPATVTVQVAAQAKATAIVPALVKLAVAEPPPSVTPPGEPVTGPAAPVEIDRKDRIVPPAHTGVSPRLRHAAFGLSFGFTHAGDATLGARAIIQTSVGPGAVRGVVSAFYTHEARLELDTMDDATRTLVWFGAEYLLAWRSGLASAAGVGYGIEHIAGGYDLQEGTKAVTRGYPSLRVSPIILRLSSAPLELGLHGVLDFRKDLQSGESAMVLIGTLALDWFFW